MNSYKRESFMKGMLLSLLGGSGYKSPVLRRIRHIPPSEPKVRTPEEKARKRFFHKRSVSNRMRRGYI